MLFSTFVSDVLRRLATLRGAVLAERSMVVDFTAVTFLLASASGTECGRADLDAYGEVCGASRGLSAVALARAEFFSSGHTVALAAAGGPYRFASE